MHRQHNGLKTAAFVSGYPRLPLGGFDMELEKALRVATDVDVVLQPAVNEELGGRRDGAPTRDRTARRRPQGVPRAPGRRGRYRQAVTLSAANRGTLLEGEAIALVGDDPAAKSSTIPSSSDATIYDLHVPLFIRRRAGGRRPRQAAGAQPLNTVWTSVDRLPVAGGSGTVDLGLDQVEIVTPDLSIPGDPNGTIYEPRPEGVSSLENARART